MAAEEEWWAEVQSLLATITRPAAIGSHARSICVIFSLHRLSTNWMQLRQMARVNRGCSTMLNCVRCVREGMFHQITILYDEFYLRSQLRSLFGP